MATESRDPMKVFISYSHEDKLLHDELVVHLKPLEQHGVIKLWSDVQIMAGDVWESAILENLKAADIILLLISADFLASAFIQREELTHALQRHQAGTARIVPVLLRSVKYQGHWFTELEMLPVDSKKRLKPVKSWNDRDQAYTSIADAIERVAEHLRARNAHPHSGQGGDPAPEISEADARPSDLGHPVVQPPVAPAIPTLLERLWLMVRRYRRLVLAVMVSLLLLWLFGPQILNLMLLARPTLLTSVIDPATPRFPQTPQIATAGLQQCPKAIDFTEAIRTVLPESAGASNTPSITLLALDQPSAQRWEELRQQGTLLTVEGQCEPANADQLNITVTLSSRAVYPVQFLAEPRHMQLQAGFSQARAFVQGSALYAAGHYAEARDLLYPYRFQAASNKQRDFNWLLGNVHLRLDQWDAAKAAYSNALIDLHADQDSEVMARLLANRALTELFAQVAQPTGSQSCSINGRADVQRAIELLADPQSNADLRAKLYVLSGYMILGCPKQDEEIAGQVLAVANQAASTAGDTPAQDTKALFTALSARIRAESRTPEMGAVDDMMHQACEAAALDLTLPDPHRTLGLLYADSGHAEIARQHFKQYGRLSSLAWQRDEAIRLYWKTYRWDRDPPGGSLSQTEPSC